MSATQLHGSLYSTTVGRGTEEELVVAARDYWGNSLKAQIEDMPPVKKEHHQCVRSGRLQTAHTFARATVDGTPEGSSAIYCQGEIHCKIPHCLASNTGSGSRCINIGSGMAGIKKLHLIDPCLEYPPFPGKEEYDTVSLK